MVLEHFLVDIDDEPEVVQALNEAGFEVEPSESPIGKFKVVKDDDN